nr:unnamed protein product [Spirometra erinaceieuropaei]
MSGTQDRLDNLSAEERAKIGEVIRSQGDNSTAWMYEQPKKNAEDFLLGKAVKSLEELAEISRDEAEETPAQRLARLDMQAKFREDPLNLMRQHELDKRNALLQNTAKMKKLQRLIEKQKRQQKKRDHRRNRKKKSKHSARHHHRESNDDSCSSSSDSEDDAILDKFISLIQQQEPGVDSSGLDSLQRHVEKKKEERPSKKKKKSKEHVTKKKHKHHDREKHSHNRSQSPKVKEEEKKILRPDPPARRSSPPPIHRLPPSTTKRRPSPAPRRSREEMAALRAQMAADAKERERERVERYQRHQTEAKQQEASELASRNTHGASFLKGLTLAHVATSSVEEGVQRKASSRQRGGMEENFLRH